MKTWKEMSVRERDRLVAEKLFGWQERPCDLNESGGELTIYSSGDASCPRCGAYGHINDIEHGMMPPAHYTTNWTGAHFVIQHVKSQFLLSKRQRFWQEVQYSVSRRIDMQSGLVDWPDVFFLLEPDIPGFAALRTIGCDIAEGQDHRLAFSDHQRRDEQALHRLAAFGTTNDIYRVDARFSHIDGPVTYLTNDGKPDAYRQVANWLMSKQIQRVQVYKNDQLAQTITADNPQQEKEVPSGTNKEG